MATYTKADYRKAGDEWLAHARLIWAHLNKVALLTTICAASAISFAVIAHSFYSWLFAAFLLCLSTALVLSKHSNGPWPLLLGILTLPLFWAIGIWSSTYWDFNQTYATLVIFAWWVAMFFLYRSQIEPKVFDLLIPLWALAAFTVIYGGVNEVNRAGGIVGNPNEAAGLLVLGIAYLGSKKKTQFLIIPLLWALLFTGSRLATIVAVVILGGLALSHLISWHRLAGTIAVTVILILPFADTIQLGYRFTSISEVRPQATGDIQDRLTWRPAQTLKSADHPEVKRAWPGMIPLGYIGSSGPHSTPLRMIFELGIIPMAIIAWVNIWALWIRPRGTTAWWMLLAFVGLNSLDYYAWMPFTICIFWPLLIAMRAREGRLFCHKLYNPTHKPTVTSFE